MRRRVGSPSTRKNRARVATSVSVKVAVVVMRCRVWPTCVRASALRPSPAFVDDASGWPYPTAVTLQCAPLDWGAPRDAPSRTQFVDPEQRALVVRADSPAELREHLAVLVSGVDATCRWLALICGRREEIEYALAASGIGTAAAAAPLARGGTTGSLVELSASDQAAACLVDALEFGRLRLSLLLADTGEDVDRLRSRLLGGRHMEAVQRARLSVIAAGDQASALVTSGDVQGLPSGLPKPELAGVPLPRWVSAVPAPSPQPPLRLRFLVVAPVAAVAVVVLGTLIVVSRHSGGESGSTSAPVAGGASVFRPSPGSVPPPREFAAAAVDPATGELVLTGGLGACCGVEGRILDDTWRLRSGGWSLDSGRGPRPRWGAAMAYDANAHDLVLWGGARGVGDDTWVWNGQSWSEVRPFPAPVLCEPSMATDSATGDPWLVGSCATLPFPGVDAPLRTWRWQVDRWEDLASNNDQPTVTRPHLVADPASGSMLLVGEQPGSYTGLSTWRWDGAAWRHLDPPSALPASTSYAVAADPGDRLVVLVADGGGVWTWDGQTWTPRPVAGLSQPGHIAAAVTDGATDVFLGGPLASSDTAELWNWRAGRGWERLQALSTSTS